MHSRYMYTILNTYIVVHVYHTQYCIVYKYTIPNT